MRKVRCYECGKIYDYAEDAFCPRCGAFNQAPHSARIGADGAVIRDGLRESGHEGSFLHQEYHQEEKVRRRAGLEKGKKAFGTAASASALPRTARRQKKSKERSGLDMGAVLRWIIIIFVLLQFFARVF